MHRRWPRGRRRSCCALSSDGRPRVSSDRRLSIFRCAQHPKIEPKIEAMKGELPTYLRLVGEIKPRSARLDDKGKDTFDLLTWWRGNEGSLPAFSYVLRAILTNSPNSIPPERVFSILNDTFDDDQNSAMADYMEYSLMSQYNRRGRGCE